MLWLTRRSSLRCSQGRSWAAMGSEHLVTSPLNPDKAVGSWVIAFSSSGVAAGHGPPPVIPWAGIEVLGVFDLSTFQTKELMWRKAVWHLPPQSACPGVNKELSMALHGQETMPFSWVWSLCHMQSGIWEPPSFSRA